jgi:hypothetical protein
MSLDRDSDNDTSTTLDIEAIVPEERSKDIFTSSSQEGSSTLSLDEEVVAKVEEIVDEGMDIYTYLAIYISVFPLTNSRREDKGIDLQKVEYVVSALQDAFNILVGFLLHFVVPIVMLVSLLKSDYSLRPISQDHTLRFVGFCTVCYSIADLRYQIQQQVSWLVIKYRNRALLRGVVYSPSFLYSSYTTGLASKAYIRVWMLYVGVGINMIVCGVVASLVYILGCNTDSIQDFVFNIATLNFFLLVDNQVSRLLRGYLRKKLRVMKFLKGHLEFLLGLSADEGDPLGKSSRVWEIYKGWKRGIGWEFFFLILLYIFLWTLPLCFLFLSTPEEIKSSSSET